MNENKHILIIYLFPVELQCVVSMRILINAKHAPDWWKDLTITTTLGWKTHSWDMFACIQNVFERNLAAAETTSAEFAHVDFGTELGVVCVVWLWSPALLFPSWELPLTPCLPSSSSPIALYEAVKLFYIMSALPSPLPLSLLTLQISLVIMEIGPRCR